MQIKMANADKLMECVATYLEKSQLSNLTKLFKMIQQFKYMQGEVVVNSLDENKISELEQLNLDQRGLYQESCLAFNNPINSFIFDGEKDQELII